MIDTHCHIDLYADPLKIANESERLGIITIGMTNLPSHFEMGYLHLLSFKCVRLALGMHPLYANQHEREINSFVSNLSKTSYIGEIGLDYSREGISTKELQLNSLRRILKEISGKKKILSLHSRKAEKDVLDLLIANNIQNAIFHWYSGPLSLIEKIINAGYYFSINPAMIKSKSAQEIIKQIPLNKILTESDGPFIDIQMKPVEPKDMVLVCQYLSNIWNKSLIETEFIISSNFQKLLSNIKA